MKTFFFKCLVLFWAISVCGIAQNRNAAISGSNLKDVTIQTGDIIKNITNTKTYIQQLDKKTIKQLTTLPIINEKLDTISAFMQSLKSQQEFVQTLLVQKDNAITAKNDSLKMLKEEMQAVIQNADSVIALLKQQEKSVGNPSWLKQIPIFGIKQFTHGKGAWGGLFLGTEVGFLAAGTGLMINSNHLYGRYKETEYQPYFDRCKTQEYWAYGCFAGAAAMLIWNICHSSTLKSEPVSLMPDLLLDPQGNLIPALTMNINF